MGANKETKTDNDKKMLGAFVPTNLYWEFKRTAAKRQEDMQEAMEHAARLYLDADRGEDADGHK